MIIEQIIEIPLMSTEGHNSPVQVSSIGIEEVRKLLQKEMIEQGTLEVTSLDGWEAHILEHYAKS